MLKFTAVLSILFLVTFGAAAQQCLYDDGLTGGALVRSNCDVRIGPAMASPYGILDVSKNSSSDLLIRFGNTGPGGAKQRFMAADTKEARYQATHHASWTAEMAAGYSSANNNGNYLQFRVRGAADANAEEGLAASTRMTIFGNGKVFIGGTPDPNSTYRLYVGGDTHVNGTITGQNITAHYQDIAEWVPVTEDLAPGTVVIVNPDEVNHVMRSHGSYDTRVAGVVSAQPGITLGVEAAGQETVATTGRVLVQVDATNAPVRAGDLLVTSDIPGVAMRSEPITIGGALVHRPGTIIGKALQPLANGRGTILVLLSMQ